jgi:hypothetical protein
MNRIKDFLLDHPKVIVLIAAIGVLSAVDNYAHAVRIVKNIEDLRASEALGG